MNIVAAATWEVRRLSVAEYPPVKLMKVGITPTGFAMTNSAVTILA